MRLAGKKALVTGGSRGIGAAIAKRLADEGADVAITYNASPDKAEEIAAYIKQQGRNGFAVQADATRPETLAPKIEQAIETLGGLDILVNNAGGGTGKAHDDFKHCDLSDFDRVMSLNVRATLKRRMRRKTIWGKGDALS